MNITAAMVKELRERTGAGMMECKKALTEVGNIEEAVIVLRKAGQAKADKRASKVAAEGVIAMTQSADNKKGVMIEINSQTDFASKSEDLKAFSAKVSDLVLNSSINSIEELLQSNLGNGQTVELARLELVAKIGENIQLRRMGKFESQSLVGTYVHGDRIGVLVELEGGDLNLARGIAMHIAASNPKALDANAIPAELIEVEREIFLTQAQESGKPKEIAEKMVEGRIAKFLKENSLLGQPFIKNPDQSVADLLKSHQAKIKQYLRFEVGEGIEKEVTDFAAEVMAQVKGNQ